MRQAYLYRIHTRFYCITLSDVLENDAWNAFPQLSTVWLLHWTVFVYPLLSLCVELYYENASQNVQSSQIYARQCHSHYHGYCDVFNLTIDCLTTPI